MHKRQVLIEKMFTDETEKKTFGWRISKAYPYGGTWQSGESLGLERTLKEAKKVAKDLDADVVHINR